jgi:hypothetical protein
MVSKFYCQDYVSYAHVLSTLISALDAGRITTQLGTPRGRYDEHSSRFSLSKKPRFIESSRKKENVRR